MITSALSKHLSEIGLSHGAALEIMTKHAQRIEEFDNMRLVKVEMSEKTVLVFKVESTMKREWIEAIMAKTEEYFGKGKCLILCGADFIGSIEK